MVEAAAEADDVLMNKYLEEGDLSTEEIVAGLRKRTINLEIVPMTCGSAFKNKGVQAALDKIVELMPSPLDVPAIKGHLDDKDETQAERHASDDEPSCSISFQDCN